MSEETSYPKMFLKRFGSRIEIDFGNEKMSPEQNVKAVKLISCLSQLIDEFIRATTKHPMPFHTTHEGYAVVAEELDEVWDAVRSNQKVAAVKEAIETSAMGLRFAYDLGE